MTGGFKQSPLRLNQGLGDIEAWNEEAIRARADRLAKLAAGVWKMPTLPDDVYKSFQTPKEPTHVYSIDDHPYLLSGVTKDLYEAFRKEVMALDPCVTEEFWKYYVAYKAETNFVDVVPQTKRLRLSLNMEFHELQDPKGLARDITNIGRWGNGDVEVGLNSIDELPYVMGLVRQSFEKQMGNGDDS